MEIFSRIVVSLARQCTSRAQWPLAPDFCSRVTRKSQLFHTNHMLGTLNFTSSEHWAPSNFCQSTALSCALRDSSQEVYLLSKIGLKKTTKLKETSILKKQFFYNKRIEIESTFSGPNVKCGEQLKAFTVNFMPGFSVHLHLCTWASISFRSDIQTPKI